jgi:recombination protein RecA
MKEKVKEKEKMSKKEAKLKALQLTLDKLDKPTKRNCYENGDRAIVEVETISSGSLGIDLALGVGGYPRGRVIDGPESLKDYIDTSCYAEAQKNCCLLMNTHSTEIMLKN